MFISSSLLAQETDFVFDYYGVEDGLSQSEVYCVFQDSRGLIWIGTQAGLNRFDGRSFKSYDIDPLDENAISSGWIYAIDEDSDGNLWIATQNGLNKYNPRTKKFTNYLTSLKEKKELIGNNNVFGVLVENNDAIWIKTNYTISKFIPSKNHFIHYRHKHDEFTKIDDDFSFPMLKTEEGIWTGSAFGLQFLSFKHKSIKTFNANPDFPNQTMQSNYVLSLAQDRSGNIYVGTDKGISYFLTFYKKFRTSFAVEYNSILKQNNISLISGIIIKETDRNRDLVLSSFNGIISFDLNRKTHKVFREDKANPKSLNYNRIKSLYYDKSGNIWIGLNTKGLNKYSPKADKFKTFRNSGNSGVQIPDNVVASIYANKKEIWVGTWSEGLAIINRRTRKVKVINKSGPTNNRVVDNHVHTIERLPNGIIWIGTKAGISIYSPITNHFKSFEEYYNVDIDRNLINTRINFVKYINKEEIIIGTSSGVVFFNTKSKEFSKPFASEYASPSSAFGILIEKEKFWIGTLDGLYKFDKSKTIDTVYKAPNTIKRNSNGNYSSLNTSAILSLAKDDYNNIWIGTQIGINKLDLNSNTFTYYTRKEGLPDNTIYEFLINGDNLWFSTNRGIAVINVKTNKIRTYTNSDGLQGLEFNSGASFKNNNGEFFFGGSNGLNQFYADSIKPNPIKPITILLTYSVTDKENNKTTSSLFGIDKIYLSWQDNSVRFNFASLEYTNPEKNQFKYKLMGSNNDEWIDLKEQNYISFPTLNPGEYELIVKGSNNDLIWGNEASLKISVSYPFYANIWAYLFYSLIVLIIIFQIWNKNKKKQQKSNEEIRNKQLLNLKLEQQREELDIQHTNMTDSINYAKYIQDALLPSEYLFRKLLPNSFILFKSKDIVSGDFYWVSQQNTKTFIATVDCTGHGVPGAFMSIIGFDLLNNIVKERGIEDPGEILNQLNYGVSNTFRKSQEKSQSVRDGMDMSLVVVDHSKATVEFAGAMNPLCLIRDESISVIKGNRFAIGSFNDNEANKYDTHTIKYQKGDAFYMYSDGYPDQFGGPYGKKFKYKKFLHMLLNIHHLPVEKQKEELNENFSNWKGQFEQVDDVLVIGFKL